MKKIIEFITSIEKDKWMHFTICLVATLLMAIIFKMCHLDKASIICIPWGVCFLVGLGKELYDEFSKKGDSDAWDFAADMIGATTGCLTVLCLL
jgi:uncharacterized membrane protein YjdF